MLGLRKAVAPARDIENCRSAGILPPHTKLSGDDMRNELVAGGPRVVVARIPTIGDLTQGRPPRCSLPLGRSYGGRSRRPLDLESAVGARKQTIRRPTSLRRVF